MMVIVKHGICVQSKLKLVVLRLKCFIVAISRRKSPGVS